MLYEYFLHFSKDIVHSRKGHKDATIKKGTEKKGVHQKDMDIPHITLDMPKLMEKLNSIIPSRLTIANVKPIDSSGFSPDGADFIAYREYCRDIVKIMNGYVPCELIHGTFHIVPFLDRNSLFDVINKIVTVKKIDRFSRTSPDEAIAPIPAFIIAFDTNYHFTELKNDILNYYMNKSIEHICEFDALVVVNKGVVVKNWREKRSFFALETELDSMLSFFIIMNEYLEVDRGKEMDFRDYARKNVQYKEY